MSGHSKWHSIRHKKAITDAKRGKVLTRHARLITIAGKSEPNPENNPALRLAITNAKADSVPKDNIEKILKKLSGTDTNEKGFLEGVFEGFGPEKSPVIVRVITDNMNRTFPEVRTAFMKNGGNMGSKGSVEFLFEHVGVIVIQNNELSEEEVFEKLFDSDIKDFHFEAKESIIITPFASFGKVRDGLEKYFSITKATPEYHLKEPPEREKNIREKIQNFIDILEEIDDVDKVFWE